MADAQDDLRATAESLADDAKQVQELEEKKLEYWIQRILVWSPCRTRSSRSSTGWRARPASSARLARSCRRRSPAGHPRRASGSNAGSNRGGRPRIEAAFGECVSCVKPCSTDVRGHYWGDFNSAARKGVRVQISAPAPSCSQGFLVDRRRRASSRRRPDTMTLPELTGTTNGVDS